MSTTLDVAGVDTLEQDAFEVLRLIRSWRNIFCPINRVPPEVLALIPDFWEAMYRDGGVIALTHVCQTWREVFTSRSSLWTDFECVDADKTRTYLERSKSSPIDLSLIRDDDLSPNDPLLLVVPQAIGRLKHLCVEATPENLQDITVHLTHPAPLLESLSVDGGCKSRPGRNPILTAALFSGDLTSLHALHLQSVRTELAWRNMANLTSFGLYHMLPTDATFGRLLDFFESAPRLRSIDLRSATSVSGARNGRLVSLACLRRMEIAGDGPSSLLLNYLLIPVGAKLKIEVPSRGPLIDHHLPMYLDNLKNLPDFTKINLHVDSVCPRIRFAGPNGEVSMVSMYPRVEINRQVFASLTQLDTSKVQRMEISRANPLSADITLRALLPMENLRKLVLFQLENLWTFIHTLHPSLLTSNVTVCPKLEELVLVFHPGGDPHRHIETATRMAEARASKGSKLKYIRIVHQGGLRPAETWELRQYVFKVDFGDHGIEEADDDGNEED